MEFFMKKENVEQYMEMVEGYVATFEINKLKEYLPKGSTLLEIGMGPGKDLDQLSKTYKVVGSDNSPIFVEKYKERNTGIEVMCIDAVEMNIDRKFDCIYSNKVLQHLTRKDFIKSLKNQKKNLNDDGIVFMTLWRGEYEEKIEFDGQIRFTTYLEEDIKEIVRSDYEIIHLESYNESVEVEEEQENEDNSLLVILKKK